MTSNDSPSPLKASASYEESSNPAYYAFDGSSNTHWNGGQGGAGTWIQLDFGMYVKINAFSIRSTDYGEDCPQRIALKCSNDGISFDVVGEFDTGFKNGVKDQTVIFDLIEPIEYRYFRIETVVASEGGLNNIREIRFSTVPFHNRILIVTDDERVQSVRKIGGQSLDPTYKGSGVLLHNANKTATIFGQNDVVVGVMPINRGKAYWEVVIDSGNHVMIGVTKDGDNLSSRNYNTGNSRYYYSYNGNKWSTVEEAYGATFTQGDVIGVALDMDNGTIEFYKNGESQGIAYTNVLALLGSVRPSATRGISQGSSVITFSFVESEFKYDVPEGFLPYGEFFSVAVTVPSLSEKCFIKYGTVDPAHIDFQSKVEYRRYIEFESEQLNEGVIYTHKIKFDKHKFKTIYF